MSVGIDKLASELQKVIEEKDKNKKSPYDTEAEVVRVDSDVVWVKIPGGVDETPAQRTVDAKPGDNVQVRVSGGSAFLVGNGTNPPTDDTVAYRAIGRADDANENARVAGVAADAAIESANQANEKAIEATEFATQAKTQAGEATEAANEAKSQASAATTAANQAKTQAAEAETAANEAKTSAAEATTAANEAKTQASEATTAANQAKDDAAKANTAANGAVTSLGIVQGVVDGLSTDMDEMQTHVAMMDAVVDPDSGKTLVPAGLHVVPTSNGYFVVLSNDGMYVYDNESDLVAIFGENIKFDSIRPQRIGGDDAYIEYYDSDNDGKADSLRIVGANISSSTGIPTKVSELQNDSGYTTKTYVDDAVGDTATDLANYILSNDKAIDDLERQIDGAIDTWYYAVDPTTSNEPAKDWTTEALKESHLRDLYFNTSNGHTWRWAKDGSTYKWIQIEDADAIKALADAAKAQTTANVKKRVFVTTPVPPYDVGDLWVGGSKGDIKKCKTAKAEGQSYAASDWELASKYTDDTNLNNYKTEVSNTYSTKVEVQQTESTLEGKITAAETSSKSYADGLIEQEVSDRNTAIQASADGITTSVSQNYTKTVDLANTDAVKAAKKAGTDAQSALNTYKTTNDAAVAAAKKAGDDAQADLDDYKDTVQETYATKTQLTQTESSIKSEVSSTYATKSSVPTKVSQLTNDSKYATQTQAQGYADTAESNAKADATTKANAAEANAKADATTKANAAEANAKADTTEKLKSYSTTTQMNSAIEQKANSIALSVAQTEISKIEVGGRNLVPNSEYIVHSNRGDSYAWGINRQTVDVIPGETYTLSRYYNGAKESTNEHGYAYAYAIKSDGTKISGDYMTNTNANIKTRTMDSDVVKLEVITGGIKNCSIGDIYRVKLEKGNKATDWTPAPEDLEAYTDTQVSAAKAEIKVTTDNISSEVSKKVGNSEIISKINQSAEGIQIEAKNIEFKGSVVFNAIKSQTDAAYDAKGSASAVQTNLDNLEIGGRNLVWDTEWNNISTRWANWGSPTTREIVTANGKRWLHLVTTASSYQGYSQAQDKRNGYGEIKAGDKVVISYSAYAKTAGQICTVGCHWRNSSGTIVAQNWFTSTLTTTEKRYTSEVFTIPNNAVGFNVMVGDGTANAQELWISQVKIEFGTKATDWSPAPEDVDATISDVRSWYAICSTAAATAAKVATITPETTAFTTSVLTPGTLVNVKFTVTNTAAIGDLTLNVNNTGAKYIKTLRYGTITNIAGAGYLYQNVTYQFTYDGTYWVMQENYNSDTVNRTRWQNVIAAAEAITNYHIICGTASGYRNIAANVSFDMAYPLLYAGTAIAKGATTGTRDNNFLEINEVNASSNGTITSGAANKVLFLKGTLTNNTFKIAESPFMTTVAPTSQDNFCYIPLGIMYSATNIYFRSSDQLYAYKDGAFGPVSVREASAAAKTATTYITDIDSQKGITIKPAVKTGNDFLQINSSAVSIYRNNVEVTRLEDASARFGANANPHTTVNSTGLHVWKGAESTATNEVASFGATARIGAKVASSSYIDLEPTAMTLYGTNSSNQESPLFKVGNLLNETDEDSFIGNGTAKEFCLSSNFSTGEPPNLVVKVNGTTKTKGTDYSHRYKNSRSYIVFKTAPAALAEITASYTLSFSTPYLSMGNRKSGTVVKAQSFTMGKDCEASGNYSHAFGVNSRATYYGASADGIDVTASGQYSRAEGKGTTASGSFSHAEGYNTTASEWYGHAQNEGTIANSLAQTALGRYNIADDGYNNPDLRGNYVVIVGNGQSSNNRSNALTVDWDGWVKCKGVGALDDTYGSYKEVYVGNYTTRAKQINPSLTASNSDSDWLHAALAAICQDYHYHSWTIFKGRLAPNSDGFFKVCVYDPNEINAIGTPRYSYGIWTKWWGRLGLFATDNYEFKYIQIH